MGFRQPPPLRDPIDSYSWKEWFRLLWQNLKDSAEGIFGDLTVDYIQFNDGVSPVPTDDRTLYWDDDEETLSLVTPGNIYQYGQELATIVKNQTGSTITNGTPVMFAGTLGASGRILIQKAIADGSLAAFYTIGLVTEDISTGSEGKVTWFGKIRGIDTSGTPYGEVWSNGDILYISETTAGYLTKTPPSAPNLRIPVAAVVYAHATSGSLFCRPTWFSKVEDLDDVNGTSLTTDGQILVWSQTNGYHDFNYNINDYVTESSPDDIDIPDNTSSAWKVYVNSDTGRYLEFITTNGAEYLDLRNFQLKVGDGTNQTVVEDDGFVRHDGDARAWDDVYPVAISSETVAVNAASVTNYTGNFYAYEFVGTGPNSKEVQLDFQLYHSYDEGTDIEPHLHLYIPDDATGGDIKFYIEYEWSNIGDTGAYSTTTISNTITIGASAGIYKNYYMDIGSIAGTGKTISSLLVTRLYRDPTDVADTFGASVWLLSADCHMIKDTLGSRAEASK